MQPESIEVSNTEQVLEIKWEDGSNSEYPLYGLRKNCPCVICRGGHGQMADFEPDAFHVKDPPRIEVKNIKQIGNHAIQITWSDGHDSGMYRWETLKMLDPSQDNDTDYEEIG